MAWLKFFLLGGGVLVVASFLVLPPLMEKLSGKHVDTPAPEFSLTTGGWQSGSFLRTERQGCRPSVLGYVVRTLLAGIAESGKGLCLLQKQWRRALLGGGHTCRGRYRGEGREPSLKDEVCALPVAFMENATAVRMGVNGYPTLVLLGDAGQIRFIHDGYDGSERIESDLAQEISAVLKHGT